MTCLTVQASPAISVRPTKLRSKTTNGNRAFVEGGDGRGAWARRWRDLTELHVADLGGPDGLSEAQVSLCKRVSTIECELEKMEGLLSEGADVDLDLFNRLAGNLRRLYEAIGIERRARDVTPSLADIARDIQAAKTQVVAA